MNYMAVVAFLGKKKLQDYKSEPEWIRADDGLGTWTKEFVAMSGLGSVFSQFEPKKYFGFYPLEIEYKNSAHVNNHGAYSFYYNADYGCLVACFKNTYSTMEKQILDACYSMLKKGKPVIDSKWTSFDDFVKEANS